MSQNLWRFEQDGINIKKQMRPCLITLKMMLSLANSVWQIKESEHKLYIAELKIPHFSRLTGQKSEHGNLAADARIFVSAILITVECFCRCYGNRSHSIYLVFPLINQHG